MADPAQDGWEASDEAVHRTGWLVDQVLAAPRAAALVARALDPACGAAGPTFDLLEPNEPDALGPADLLAVGLVGAPPSALAVRHLLDPAVARGLTARLRSIPADTDLWSAPGRVLDSACELWALLQEADGSGPGGAVRLLARKRPRLVPLLDPTGAALLELPDGRHWATLRAVLADAGRRDRVEALRPAAADERLPLLRLFGLAVRATAAAGRRESSGTQMSG